MNSDDIITTTNTHNMEKNIVYTLASGENILLLVLLLVAMYSEQHTRLKRSEYMTYNEQDREYLYNKTIYQANDCYIVITV